MDAHEALMLLLLTAGAFVVPLLSERLGWFRAPCEILYGTLLANVVPGATQPGTFITVLGHFGFLLLLFLAGMEIDFTLLQRRGVASAARAGLAAAGIQVIGVGLGLLFGLPPIVVLLLGALSVSVLLVVLQERGLSQGPFGQTILIVGAIGEFLTILELTAYDLVSRYGLNWELALAAAKLLALLVVGYATLRALTAAVARRPAPFRRLLAPHDPAELGVRAALALMLCFAALAVWLRIEQILATFIAGAICSFALRRPVALSDKLITVGQSFFIPVFFITVGLGLHLGDVLHGQTLELFLGLLIAVPAVRLLAVPLLRLAGLPWVETLPGALLLAAPLTLQVAVVQVGINLGQLDASTQAAVLAVAIASAVIHPLAARALLTRRRPEGDAYADAELDALFSLPPDWSGKFPRVRAVRESSFWRVGRQALEWSWPRLPAMIEHDPPNGALAGHSAPPAGYDVASAREVVREPVPSVPRVE
ncbi:MAG TPA: cation:proton antiporter [Ktedonobacterales bacterium]